MDTILEKCRRQQSLRVLGCSATASIGKIKRGNVNSVEKFFGYFGKSVFCTVCHLSTCIVISRTGTLKIVCS